MTDATQHSQGILRTKLHRPPGLATMLGRLEETAVSAPGPRRGRSRFIRRILAAFESRPGQSDASVEVSGEFGVPAGPGQPPQSNLSKPPFAPRARAAPTDLTYKEMEVLQLLAQRLSNKEIAARMFISTNTVNHHLKRTYRKLGVGGRRKAVDRAMELGIIDLEKG